MNRTSAQRSVRVVGRSARDPVPLSHELPARRGVALGECIVSVRDPFCWRGCDGHGWQHLPEQWCPDDDADDGAAA
jgi:hypothetical protein